MARNCGRTCVLAAALVALTVMLVPAGSAWADAKSGFGLGGGFASHTGKDSDGFEYSSAGLSIVLDYQIALGDSFSINPMLESSGEKVSPKDSTVTCSNCTVGHGILALEARVWVNNVFFGVHGGRYTEVRTVTVGPLSASITGSGSGGGAVIGYEADGGVFVALQGDSANITFDTFTTKLTGVRLHVGYRWK